jgi:hypothetical protein
MKALIRVFAFESWDTPGEMEAECVLCKHIMFGATNIARDS